MSFKHLKPGDQVYIVPQASKWNKPDPFWSNVLKTGSKYGYVHYGHLETPFPFDLITGQSVHHSSTARMNGFGFDVWLSKEAYDAHVAAVKSNIRLLSRLEKLKRSQYSASLDDASPALVAELHAVLDRHNV